SPPEPKDESSFPAGVSSIASKHGFPFAEPWAAATIPVTLFGLAGSVRTARSSTTPDGEASTQIPLLANVESSVPFAFTRAMRNSPAPLVLVADPPTRILPSGWRATEVG